MFREILVQLVNKANKVKLAQMVQLALRVNKVKRERLGKEERQETMV